MNLDSPITCEWMGCGVLRRTVNNWYVVWIDLNGAHIYEWEKCPAEAMKKGKHFCGLPHALLYVSNTLTQDLAKAGRESTLKLKPPLTRENTVPEAEGEDQRSV